MNENTVTALLNVKREMGASFLRNTQRVAAFLSDFLPAHPGERQFAERLVLVHLLELGVPQQLAARHPWSDAELAALAQHSAASLLLDAQATHQGVRVWHFVTHAAPGTAIDIHAILGVAVQAPQQQLLPAAPQPAAVSIVLPQRRSRSPQQASLNNVLWQACEAGDTKKVEELLKNGADANAKKAINKGNKGGDTLLTLAAGNEKMEIVKLLLAAGADASAANKEGKTALYYASMKGDVEVVKLLLAAGAYANAATEYGWTALMRAAECGHTEIFKLLLSAGAYVNAKGYGGYTALMGAAGAGHKEIVKLLIAAGADVHSKYNGKTPMKNALENRRYIIVKLLLDAGAKE